MGCDPLRNQRCYKMAGFRKVISNKMTLYLGLYMGLEATHSRGEVQPGYAKQFTTTAANEYIRISSTETGIRCQDCRTRALVSQCKTK